MIVFPKITKGNPIMYLIHCTEGTRTLALTFGGALRVPSVLRQAGGEAAVYSLFGAWVAGRKVSV
jgi:hypothetical protein